MENNNPQFISLIDYTEQTDRHVVIAAGLCCGGFWIGKAGRQTSGSLAFFGRIVTSTERGI